MRALVVLGALVLAAPAWAGDGFSWTETPATELGDKQRATYQRELAKGDEHALMAAQSRGRRQRLHRKHAQIAYENAIAARPDEPEAHYRLAEFLYAHYLSTRKIVVSKRMAEKALHHWREFERLAPLDPRATDMLFSRALVHTKLATDEHYGKGVADYETLMARTDLNSLPPEIAAVRLSNLAEMHMMLGQLDDAIPLYERAMEYNPSGFSQAYGLAVALDRDGQGAKARQIVAEYGHALERFQEELRAGDTFFVPPGEEHYYLALAHEGIGKYERAIEHYQAFIRSGAHPRFAGRARDNIGVLRELAQGERARRR